MAMNEKPPSEDIEVGITDKPKVDRSNLPEGCRVHICDFGWWRMKNGQLIPDEPPKFSSLENK